MLKKIFTIFKRDKSGFSKEELQWQLKWSKGIGKGWIVIGVLGYIIIIFILLSFKKDSIVDVYLLALVVIIIVAMIIVVGAERFFDCGRKIEDQIKEMENQEWREEYELSIAREKEKENKKIFSCIQTGSFSELEIRKPMNKVFQECLKHDVIKMEPLEDGVRVEILQSNQEVSSLTISEEELRKYFDLKG